MTAFTLSSGANDTLTFTIDSEADFVQNDEQVIFDRVQRKRALPMI